jgi:hypothetical protein
MQSTFDANHNFVGKETGKVLYIGVKNKYCLMCHRSPNKEHVCYKNFSGPSSQMETVGIIDGITYLRENCKVLVSQVWKDGDLKAEKELKK